MWRRLTHTFVGDVFFEDFFQLNKVKLFQVEKLTKYLPLLLQLDID